MVPYVMDEGIPISHPALLYPHLAKGKHAYLPSIHMHEYPMLSEGITQFWRMQFESLPGRVTLLLTHF